MTKRKFTMYPCIESTQMVDLLDCGLLKDKDAFVDCFYDYDCIETFIIKCYERYDKKNKTN